MTGGPMVRLVDPSGAAAAGAVVELTLREAAEVIIVAQAEAGDYAYDLGRLAAAVDEVLAAIDGLDTATEGGALIADALRLLVDRLRGVRSIVRDGTAELDRRTGYPEVEPIGALLDMAHDSEVYLEHVRAHARPSPDLPHVFDDAGDPDAIDCRLCGEGRLCYLHDDQLIEPPAPVETIG